MVKKNDWLYGRDELIRQIENCENAIQLNYLLYSIAIQIIDDEEDFKRIKKSLEVIQDDN